MACHAMHMHMMHHEVLIELKLLFAIHWIGLQYKFRELKLNISFLPNARACVVVCTGVHERARDRDPGRTLVVRSSGISQFH